MLSFDVQSHSITQPLGQLKARLDALAAVSRKIGRRVVTGWEKADGWLGGGLCCGATHEWVGVFDIPPISILMHVAARAAEAAGESHIHPWIVCVGQEVWPTPHVVLRAGGGALLKRMLLIDPPSTHDRHWAIELALRCEGLVVIADASGMDMGCSRRMQLAAEHGLSLGLFARPAGEALAMSVAATRWLVKPVASSGNAPRWQVTLVRCKGMQSAETLAGGVMRGMVRDDRSLLVEVNDAGCVVAVHADICKRCDSIAAAS